MIMGIFQIHGMEPGPLIFINSSDLVWVTFAAMFWANLFIVFLGWLQTKTVVHILTCVPLAGAGYPDACDHRRLRAAQSDHRCLGDVPGRDPGLPVEAHRIFGCGDRARVDPRQAGESAFSKSMQLMDYDFLGFFSRPISAVLLVLGLAAIANQCLERDPWQGLPEGPDGLTGLPLARR